MQEEEQIGLEATSYLAGIADQLCMYYGGSTVWSVNDGQIRNKYKKPVMLIFWIGPKQHWI